MKPFYFPHSFISLKDKISKRFRAWEQRAHEVSKGLEEYIVRLLY